MHYHAMTDGRITLTPRNCAKIAPIILNGLMKEKRSTGYQRVIILFLIWLVAVNVFAYITSNRFNLTSDNSYEWMQPAEQFTPKRVDNLVDSHVRWDSLWYLDIAQNGYFYKGEGQLSNIVFFPMYPGLIALFGWAIGFQLAGWLVALAALLGAILLLTKYVQEHHPDLDHDDVIFFLLIFPTAVFLDAVYTESLFLLFTIATFYFGLKRNFLVASIFGMAAALTRVTGVLLVLPLLIEYITAVKLEKKKFGLDLFALGLIPLGLLAFFAYHWLAFGSPTIFFDVQSTWGRGFELESKHFLTQTLPATMNLWLDVFFTVFAVVATWFVWKRLRPSYAVYMFLGFMIPILTGTLMSVGRYLVVLFPIFLLAAGIKNKIVRQTWIIISILLFALYTILFAVNYWAG